MDNKEVMTLGIFAHANAGKTTVTEQLLYHTNVKKTIGRVDYGNTTTDNLKVEQERGISVRASMVTLPLNDRHVQLIDTPGHVDFSSEVERAINVLDGAILVVSGVEGVEPQTQVIWKILQERRIPTIIFINKMDRMGSDYNKVIKEMQNKLSASILPIVEVTKNSDGSLNYTDTRDEDIIEYLAEIDEFILEKYLKNDSFSKDWLENYIMKLTHSAKLFFAFGGSALLDEGIKKLIVGISKYLPCSPKKKSDEFTGYVYTIKRDAGARELYIKVLNGSIKNRQELIISPRLKQRVKTITKIDGTKKIKCNNLETGEIGIITGISSRCGDIIGKEIPDFKYLSFINPLFHTNVSVKNATQLQQLVTGLEILNDEDPDLHLTFYKETGQISIDLMGPLQIEIIANQLKERFNVEAVFSNTTIIHKETPVNFGYGDASYDGVSAIKFEIKPLSRGSGLKYTSKISTDYLFSKYQKQIERLVKVYVQQGLYGWEITDAEISLIDGKSDSVCSDPFHFNVIVPLALMRSLKDAKMQLLEPIMSYEISIPKDSLITVFTSLSFMEVDYEKIIQSNDNIIIPGNAPLTLMLELPTIITKLTGGRGSLIKKPNGYELKKNQEILEKQAMGYDPRNEELFLMSMNSSIDHIDRSSKRR